MQVAPRNWLHGSMGMSRSFAEEWNALAAVDLFGLQSMQQLEVVIRERDVETQEELADALRISRTTLYRAMDKLVSNGKIERHGRAFRLSKGENE